ncbi:PH domain-containing protein [Rhodococcus sp. HM1]|uniref:PH domain-containing protein n=1 Tax=unclassified Rhodococcus (in: high G+C Gram-positive bacteria) TaxID=192944 RepID=UPI0018CF33A0|nr:MULTISPECIES: PH domain-containing protein [unclassified Rhodococcus (in: high G+C Gram-positive bacteria)]MBH0123425.1 PH domain-containing protein [Rhodococcus sp. CX]MCK8670230.1 PH domain-containing protein [Rhodococcus sp. HM1]
MPPRSSSHTPESATRVIRISRLSLLACGILLLAVASPAMAWPAAFSWMLVIPFLVLAWILRVRTVVGPDGITARATFSTTRIGWGALAGIRFPKRGWARATLTDGSEVPLPVVTFGRLPELAEASGGRITDPYAAADAARSAEDRSTEATAEDSAAESDDASK